MAQTLKPDRLDNRGGSRKNSGAKHKGNVQYKRNLPLDFVAKMDAYLEKLKTAII
jgi:hypothetical protein